MTARPDAALLLSWAATAQESAPNDEGWRVVAFVGFIIFLVGVVVAGVLAYTGRWRSWYPGRFRITFMPLAAPWQAGAALLMLALVGLHELLDPIPGPVFIAGITLAIGSLLVSGIYVIYPPRRMRPRWIRWLEGDTSIPDPDLDRVASVLVAIAVRLVQRDERR